MICGGDIIFPSCIGKDLKMEELINLIVAKTGISHDQAKMAIDVVVNFLKEKLPAPLAGQIDGLLGGSGPADLAKGLGGLFG
jgi:hypothetical protein